MAKSKKKKHRVLKRVIILIIILALLGAGVYFIGYPMLKASTTTTYDEYTASVGTISNSLSFSANFSAKDAKTVTASASTTVRTIYVTEGQKVASGDKLMRLADGEIIKADFDGTINAINVEEGDEVSAQTQLMQYADFTHMTVSIRVDEYDISSVSVGQACTVTATALERSFSTTIAHINYISASNGNVAYYTATADVEVDDGVYPGMQATVTIPQEEAVDVVILKMDALSFDASNNAYVYMQDEDGKMKEVQVEIGVNNGNYVEITSGLSEGDKVYVESKQETAATGGIFSLFSNMGGTQINSGRDGKGGGSMPDMSNFDSSSFGSGSSGGFGGGGSGFTPPSGN